MKLSKNLKVAGAFSNILGCNALVAAVKFADSPGASGTNAIDPSIPTITVVAKKLTQLEKEAMDNAASKNDRSA